MAVIVSLGTSVDVLAFCVIRLLLLGTTYPLWFMKYVIQSMRYVFNEFTFFRWNKEKI